MLYKVTTKYRDEQFETTSGFMVDTAFNLCDYDASIEFMKRMEVFKGSPIAGMVRFTTSNLTACLFYERECGDYATVKIEKILTPVYHYMGSIELK